MNRRYYLMSTLICYFLSYSDVTLTANLPPRRDSTPNRLASCLHTPRVESYEVDTVDGVATSSGRSIQSVRSYPPPHLALLRIILCFAYSVLLPCSFPLRRNLIAIQGFCRVRCTDRQASLRLREVRSDFTRPVYLFD